MRIARDPVDDAAYDALCDQGSSTFDVCADCYDDLGGDGAPWPEDEPELAPYNDEPDPEKVGGYVVTGDLDHPDYDEEAAMGEPYRCAVCGAVLEDEADG